MKKTYIRPILYLVVCITFFGIAIFKRQASIGIKAEAIVQLTSIPIASQQEAKIVATYIKEGEFVKKGQILLSLDDSKLQAKKKEIKASIKCKNDLAEKQKMLMNHAMQGYLENKADFSTKVAPSDVLDNSLCLLDKARLAYEAALSYIELEETKLVSINEQIESKNIKAPFDGIVGNINCLEGQVVLPAQTIFTLYDQSNVYAVAHIKEKDLKRIEKDTLATISLVSYPELKIDGKISFIPPVLSSKKNKTIPVKISIQSSKEIFKSNMSASVFINTKNL